MQFSLLAQLAFGLTVASAASLPQEGAFCQTPRGSGKCQTSDQCNGYSDWDITCPFTSRCCVTHITPAKRNDECASPAKDTCSFYENCLEAKVPCGPDGYALAYGDHYCNKFSEASHDLSEKGQAWVTETMLCLQQKLVPFGTGQEQTTCPAIREFAFATHPDCYIKGGVCLLPPTDWVVIVGTVGLLELFDSVDALVATLKTVGGCLEFYLWLIKNHFIGQSKLWDVTDRLAIAPE
ncbi:hypothetical protein MferCBS31731_005278 [Microsporum ferrugineum]